MVAGGRAAVAAEEKIVLVAKRMVASVSAEGAVAALGCSPADPGTRPATPHRGRSSGAPDTVGAVSTPETLPGYRRAAPRGSRGTTVAPPPGYGRAP